MDVFSKKKFFLCDIHMSQTLKPGLLVSLRIISIDGINFSSGAGCVFENEILNQLMKNFTDLYEKKGHMMSWDEMMFEYNPYFFQDDEKVRKSNFVFRCLKSRRISLIKERRNMEIDIEQLSEKELIDLNHRIIQRLRFLEAARANSEMIKFSVGDKVTFKPSGDKQQTGVLVKYNKKTVTVLTDQGVRWNVSPNLLTKTEGSQSEKMRFGKHNYN
jgi:hypothetical protein